MGGAAGVGRGLGPGRGRGNPRRGRERTPQDRAPPPTRYSLILKCPLLGQGRRGARARRPAPRATQGQPHPGWAPGVGGGKGDPGEGPGGRRPSRPGARERSTPKPGAISPRNPAVVSVRRPRVRIPRPPTRPPDLSGSPAGRDRPAAALARLPAPAPPPPPPQAPSGGLTRNFADLRGDTPRRGRQVGVLQDFGAPSRLVPRPASSACSPPLLRGQRRRCSGLLRDQSPRSG